MNGQLALERGFITEQLTDSEIIKLDYAVSIFNFGGCEEIITLSDRIVSELPCRLWKQIWEYREHYADCCGGGKL